MRHLLALLLALLAAPLAAAPTLAAGWVTNTASSGESITMAFTVVSGSDRCLVVTVQSYNTQTVDTVTYGGAEMTLFRDSGPLGYNGLYYLKGPAVGTANVIATFAGPTSGSILGALQLNGVDPYVAGNSVSHTRGGDINSAMTTTYANSAVVDAAVQWRDTAVSTSWTADAAMTAMWNSADTNARISGAYVLDAGAAGSKTYVDTWTGGTGIIISNRVLAEFPPVQPTPTPTASPTGTPTASPSASPTGTPTASPSATPTASPTGTPTPICELIGQTTPIVTAYYGFPMLSGNKYNFTNTVYLNRYAVYLKSAGSVIQMGLYTNLSGRAHTRVLQSYTATAQVGWNTLTGPQTMVPPGEYWLVMQASDLDARVYGGPVADMFIQRVPSTSGAMPSVVTGIVYRNKYRFSAYADVCQ